MDPVIGALKCGKCKDVVWGNDSVILDDFHTILHVKCYTGWRYQEIDRGRFYELVDKYDFFKQC